MATLEEIIARWDSGDGKPYKGKLIDWDTYGGDGEEPPVNIGCMCAQGQVLNLLGGWTPFQLHSAAQSDADRETAKLLGISRGHAILLRKINDSVDGAPSIVLTHPEKVLGSQAKIVLAFWRHVDSMDAGQWAARAAARDAARDARAAAWAAARDAAGAVSEIQGAALMRERGQPFFFLPMFGFSSPEEIPLRND